jgi:hypothetical protein
MDTMQFCKPIGGIFILLEALLGIYGSSFPASPTQYVFVHLDFASGVLFVPGVAALALSRFNRWISVPFSGAHAAELATIAFVFPKSQFVSEFIPKSWSRGRGCGRAVIWRGCNALL